MVKSNGTGPTEWQLAYSLRGSFFVPQLGRMTAGLADSCTGSHFGSDSLTSAPNKVRKKNKNIKKGEAVMLVKKHLVPSHSSAYSKNSTWTNLQPQPPSTKKQKASVVVPKSKNVTIKKRIKVSKTARPPNTEQLLKQAKQIAGDTKNLHLLQEAIVEFKTQRDEFVHSLNGLQKKLKDFQIPELFAPSSSSKTDEGKKHHGNSPEKRNKRRNKESREDKTDDKGDRNPEGKPDRKKKKKDVRSVSQHFYLADMTESEDSSTTSSSSLESSSSEDKSEADEKLADKKVNDFLDFNLIPIQPPEKGRNLDRVNSLMKHSSPWATKKSKSTVDGKLSMKRSVVEISDKKIPVKAEVSRQKSSFKASNFDTPTKAAVQAEFKKLQKARENHMRLKVRNT